MLLVIIIGVRGKTMLQRALGSGWGMLIPGGIIAALGFADLSAETWRGLIVVGLLLTSSMIWHHKLRHYVLLPSCVALIGGMMLIMLNMKLLG
ncbi:DUF1435 domain-containing protein [Trabulsiella odontotermitis]|nr:DUF1435 domain-containing protein [Trabulsiella odontotermitis]